MKTREKIENLLMELRDLERASINELLYSLLEMRDNNDNQWYDSAIGC